MRQPCARWGCKNSATYDLPLCREHWQDWDAFELDECSCCHWFYDNAEFIIWDLSDDIDDKHPLMCNNCLAIELIESGKVNPWPGVEWEKRSVASHKTIERLQRYVYILKLSDATFYPGQTKDLAVRLQEHRDGQQRQTKGKDPKLVYFEMFEGMREEVNDREKELNQLNKTSLGRRRIRQMVEEFRSHFRLVDLER